jgi:LuxR family maltose regulon positive regulatory protein
VREGDLRFELTETTIFLNETMGLSLTADEVLALETHTEGWITGLQLAALALRTSTPIPQDTAKFIATFSGTQQYILEYLVEEVLSHQSEIVQNFLLKTSILEHLCASLCEAVIQGATAAYPPQISTGQEILDYLERTNLFTISVDDDHHWYRYHHLFADLLANQLRQTLPVEAIQQLHRRASAWYAQHDLIGEAIYHALEGKDEVSAASLIKQATQSMMSTGQVGTLHNWLEALPVEAFQTYPHLKMCRGWIYAVQGDIARSAQTLQEALDTLETLPVSPEYAMLRLELLSILCRNVLIWVDTSKAIERSQAVLSLLPQENVTARARVLSALALAYGFEGQSDKALQAYHECLGLTRTIGNYFLIANTTAMMSLGLLENGQLHETVRFNRAIIDEEVESKQRIFFPAGVGYLGLANVYLEWNDLKTAKHYLTQGMELCRQGGLTGDLRMGYIISARLHQACGDFIGATAELAAWQELSRNTDTSFDAGFAVARQIQLRLSMGDIDGAVRDSLPFQTMAKDDPSSQKVPLPIIERIQVALIQIFIACGEIEMAMQGLDSLQQTVEVGKRFGRLIDVHLLRALALQEQAHLTEALREFKRSLDLAEPQGYVLLYLEKGESVASLLDATISDSSTPTRLQVYVRHLLKFFSSRRKRDVALEGVSDVASSKAISDQEDVESFEQLSSRELEILHLIADGYSNQEIAEKLIVTLHTVKKHTSNLFSKLKVSSRTQAVARGRQLRLL